jgi:flagellar hook-associated protein 1 FlgK
VIGSNHEPPASGGFIATPAGSLVYELNTFATNLVTLLNGQHAGGTTWDLDGNNGGNFFTAGTNANNIAVAITDPRDLAAASGAADPGTLNSDNIRNITNLRDNANLGDAYRETVANFGTDVQQAERNLAAQELIQEQVAKRRESYSGISVDEEMTNLIVFQRAFEASARFITIIDEMYQQVVNMVR